MANGLLDYISGFGATPPEYLGGLLGQEAVDKLKSRAATTGLANAVLGYLAAPKNQNLGLGRIIGQSLQAGMTGAQGVYDTATQDYMAQQKIAEMQRQQKQQAAQDLFRSRIGQPNATRDVVTQDTMQVPVAQGIEAPNFQTQMPAPTVTQQQYFDPKVMMSEALQSGALPFEKYLEYSIKEAKPRETTIAPNGQLIYKDTGELVTATSFAAPKEEKTFKVGETRDFISGTNRITQEYQKDGTWKNISTGNAFAPANQLTVNMPSESERTAGFLTSRLQNSLNQLQGVVNKNPKAAKPTIGAEAVKALTGSDYLTNLTNPESRQQIESAQLEILDSALTLGTGAAYTREQLQNYSKSYFPQLGDKPKNIADKQARLSALLRAAKIKGGRATPDDVGLPPNVTVERVR
jgi:hypothetical protein